jgi:hypothetical protein
MVGIQFLTNDKGEKVAVQIDQTCGCVGRCL